jgi:hypothetical protein
MTIGRYYGMTEGAVVTWHGERVQELVIGSVDRNKPEGADWILRFTPRTKLPKGATRKELATRLHALAINYKVRGQPGSAVAYMQALDAAITSGAGL